MSNSELTQSVSNLPNLPGVYQFFDNSQQIIYVGKAKDLKKRVSSYFLSNVEGKTKVLVSKIVSLKYIVVDNEADALLLENSLIKKYKPRYNILLKDDKSYPWIVIKNEPFPRVFQTRNFIKDGSSYFGPYTSLTQLRVILEVIKQIYPVRTCHLNLNPTEIAKGKFSVCLDYHIGRCLGPCIGEQLADDYQQNIQQIKEILRGNINSVHHFIVDNIKSAAENLDFEKAHILKQKLLALENYQSKSVIVNSSISNIDVINYRFDNQIFYVVFFRIVNGSIIQSTIFTLIPKISETIEDLLLFALTEIISRYQYLSSEIVLPTSFDIPYKSKIVVPKLGDKKKLLDLADKNLTIYIAESVKRSSEKPNISPSERILTTLKNDLNLSQIPLRIECFDNSNIQGTHPVSSCVVFQNAKPLKKEYRHFNVKTVEGPNDFASMEEVVYRRYKRIQDENGQFPQLIIIDGGKGQLGAALNSMRKLKIDIPIIGVAKRLEEIYFPGDPVPLYLNKNSESLKLIQQLRDEAHRFGITFHRNKRSNAFLTSELDAIPGLGEKSIELLLKHFKTAQAIKEASIDALGPIVGKHRAQKIVDFFASK